MAQYLAQNRIDGPLWLEPDELFFIRTRLAASETRAEHLINELKLQDLDETHTSELIHRKDATLVEIASLRNILSPIRRIPFEILSDIFQLSCLPEDGIFTSDYDIVRFTSRISCVCVAWRSIAHSTPQIWSKICLSVRKHPKVFVADVIWIKDWIERSKGLPLELYLNLVINIGEGLDRQAAQIINSVLAFRHCIRLLSITAFPKTFLPLFRLPRSSLPLLEKVFLSMCCRDSDARTILNSFPRGIEAFLETPQVKACQHRRT
ncbi:hypothetical protein BT96DRAFT_134773 [Gymnopus androsaceus JB14]|uniref:Uncharacterized protein n=1 Tax=Gymnopus androsaceus JB14 TaxID=1447944 RepID=A0A6A4HFE2_9AGAR|nr:hypothetical protein BT96DRAFT_134773 [Gymnopus androsaceus JB14]